MTSNVESAVSSSTTSLPATSVTQEEEKDKEPITLMPSPEHKIENENIENNSGYKLNFDDDEDEDGTTICCEVNEKDEETKKNEGNHNDALKIPLNSSTL